MRRSRPCRRLRTRECTSGVSVARYYDPATAQFLTRDPLDALTRSAYGYVNNDPLNGTDPSGLSCGWSDPFGCADDVAKVAEVAAVVAVVATVAVVAAPVFLPAGAITAGIGLYAADVAGAAIATTFAADTYVATVDCSSELNGKCSRAGATVFFDASGVGIVRFLGRTNLVGRVAERSAELLGNRVNAGLAIGGLGLGKFFGLANDVDAECNAG